MQTSTLELIAIGQDMVAKLAHLPASERLIVTCAMLGVVMGEYHEDQQGALLDCARIEISCALRAAAEQEVRP